VALILPSPEEAALPCFDDGCCDVCGAPLVFTLDTEHPRRKTFICLYMFGGVKHGCRSCADKDRRQTMLLRYEAVTLEDVLRELAMALQTEDHQLLWKILPIAKRVEAQEGPRFPVQERLARLPAGVRAMARATDMLNNCWLATSFERSPPSGAYPAISLKLGARALEADRAREVANERLRHLREFSNFSREDVRSLLLQAKADAWDLVVSGGLHARLAAAERRVAELELGAEAANSPG
jgi:hypothetical protein